MTLKLVTTKEEAPGVRSFIFRKPLEFTFYPGQYLDYRLPVTDSGDYSRTFTIATSPTEDFLMLTTKARESSFKEKLFNLRPGDEIESSHPAGTFILDETSPAVMIAGGIGITPYRAMIKYALDKKLTIPLTLIYSNSDDNFPFREELETWQQNLPNLTIHWVNTSQNGLLDKEKLFSLTTDYQLPATIFYLSGPPKMVDSFDAILQSLGVEKENIRYDHFGGY